MLDYARTKDYPYFVILSMVFGVIKLQRKSWVRQPIKKVCTGVRRHVIKDPPFGRSYTTPSKWMLSIRVRQRLMNNYKLELDNSN